MQHFTPLSALAGGALIGLAATLLLLTNGRIAGVCGVFVGVLFPERGDTAWRYAFLLGLALAGGVVAWFVPGAVGESPRSLPFVAISGLLVGAGTRLGNGCTSGHGVCGLSRFSTRSLAATLTFMGTGGLAAFAARALGLPS